MIKKKISRTTFQEYLIDFVRDEMYEAAIKDDGIYSTFKLHNRYFTTGEIRITLRYCKLDCDDKWLPAQRKILYKNCPELGDVRYSASNIASCPETLQKVADRIKLDVIKNDNAIWSTIKVVPWTEHFTIYYDKACFDNDKDKVCVDKPMTAQELEIENTKRTLRRLRENSYYGLYPRHSGLTYAFDEYVAADIKATKAFDEYVAADIKTTKEAFKAIPRYLRSDCMVVNSGETLQGLEPKEQKSSFASGKPMTAQELEIENTKRTLRRVQEACDHAAKCLGFVDAETLRRISEKFSYGSHNKEEKEKKDMNVTLMVVPNGMNKDFVNKVKADFQSNTSRLFVASTDIDYSCEYEPIKTKYDLFEHWIKTGKVDVVYFMLGFEKDPDVRAFEAFVRGFTEAEVPGKIDIRVTYQKDDIVNDMNSLRTLYFDEADAKEDLQNAGDKVIKEAMKMCDVYGLNGKYLEAIKNSKGRIDASEEFVMGKIMDTAFISDEDAKPAKKGGKK